MLVLCICWLLANLVPFFSDAVDLLGASVTPPPGLYIRAPLFPRCRRAHRLPEDLLLADTDSSLHQACWG